MNESVFRIIDANCNRAAEGLRVIEDIARFTLGDSDLSQRIKSIRHELVRDINQCHYDLINRRNTSEDVGSKTEEFSSQDGISSIISANSKRSQEALRVLEEITKIDSDDFDLDSNKFKRFRFEVYEIERILISKVLRKDKIQKVTGLYPIIDTASLPNRDLQEITRQLISADVKIIQLRDKSSDNNKFFTVANQISEICRSNGVLFIVNDLIDIACAVNADGVHLGLSDLPVKVARKELPIDKIIGCSVSTVSQALQAVKDGADYIAVGSIFPTLTKQDAHITGLDMVREIHKVVDVPLVAIGGINMENAEDVLDAGADSIAVISAIFSKSNIFQYTKNFVSLIESMKR
jgi:thiamine-phosphate pyrophosphorylase